jgi:hypothetical protein
LLHQIVTRQIVTDSSVALRGWHSWLLICR